MVNTNCQEITTKINSIKSKKLDFDNLQNTDIPKAFALIKEIQISIQEIKEQLIPFILIEGNKFPIFELEIGGKTARELEKELKEKRILRSNYAEDLLHSTIFAYRSKPEQIKLVCLEVSDLGFTSEATTDEIYTRAQELGLELCPAKVGPHQLLTDANQIIGACNRIAMEQIIDRDNHPSVFSLQYHYNSLWLNTYSAEPEDKRDIDERLIFQVPTK